MAEQAAFDIRFNSNIEKIIASVSKLDVEMINVSKAVVNVDKSFQTTFNTVKNNISTIKWTSLVQGINYMVDGLSAMSQPGLELGHSLQDLSAITGVTGAGLKEIEGYARESAKTFGTSAAQGVEAYKLILSQLSPEIAKTPSALKSMGEMVSVTSKLMGNDATAAAEVLTTAMNQYNISLDDPMAASGKMAEMMNVMAAAAKEGSAELPQIKTALQQSGMMAKATGVSFEELNAAIQVLDKAGKKGAEGGTAIRNALAIFSEGRFGSAMTQKALKEAGIDIERLGDKSLTMVERMAPLKAVMNDTALMTQVFGKENLAAGLALLNNSGEITRLTGAITGTNTATEQANIIMESQIEKNARLKAKIDDLKIAMFNATDGGLGYLSVIGDIGRDIGNLLPLYSVLKNAIGFLTSVQKMSAFWTKVVTVAQWAWNAAMTANPIWFIVVGITALIAGIVLAYQKIGWFRGMIQGAWEGLKAFGTAIKDQVVDNFKKLLSGLTGIAGAIKHLFKGEWSKAWETGKKAMSDVASAGLNLSPAGALVAAVKNGDKIGKAVKKGYANGVAELAKPAVKVTGEGLRKTASAISSANVNTAFASMGEKGKAPESVVTEGRKQVILTVNIDKVIGDITQNIAQGGAQAANEIVDQVIEGITRRIHGTVRGLTS